MEVTTAIPTLETLLQDNKINKVFLDFMVKSHAEENLEFWLECEIFKHLCDEAEMRQEAKRIFTTHLQTGADLEVNLEKKFKDEVQTKMEAETWDPTLFDKPQKRIHNVLSSDCVRIFLEKYPEGKVSPKMLRKSSIPPQSNILKLFQHYLETQQEKNSDLRSNTSSRLKPCWKCGERLSIAFGRKNQ